MTLSSGELSAMRTVAEGLLTSSCTIQTLTRASDGQGGYPETWANTYTSVACMLAAPSRDDVSDLTGDRYKEVEEWRLSLHWDQTIATNNRVILNSDTFEVTSVDDDQDLRILRLATIMRTEG